MPARVTPDGVRDGDPGALAGICDRRGPAVFAYCREVCDPGRELDAAAEALAGFRAAVSQSEDPAQLDPDGLLLSLTRHAAAARAQRASDQPGLAKLLGRRSGRNPCDLMPELLVARAEQALSVADVGRLTRHLQRCRQCPETDERFRAAERAYRDPPAEPLAQPVLERLLAALASAAPVAGAATDVEPPPSAPPASAPEAGPEPEPAPYGEVPPAAAPGLQEASGEPAISPTPGSTSNGSSALPDGMGLPHDPAPYPTEPAAIGEPDLYLTESAGLAEPGPFTTDEDVASGGARSRERANRYARPVLVGRRSGFGWRWALPAGVLAAALAGALALAGVFSSGSSRSSQPPSTGTGTPAGIPAPATGGGAAAPAVRGSHRHHHRRAGTTHRPSTTHRHTTTARPHTTHRRTPRNTTTSVPAR